MLDYNKGAPPLYSQVKEILKQKIVDGTYAVNENLPTEKELQEKFQVSRITVRKSLEELFLEGFIERQRGKGTVVRSQKVIEEELHIDRSFTEEMRSKGHVPGTKSIQLNQVMAVGAIASALGVEQGTALLELIRVRTADNVPIVIFKSYMDPNLINISDEDIEKMESLYDLIRNKGISVKLSKEIFGVTLSTEWNSRLLEVPIGSPLLKRTTVVNSKGAPIMYTESTYNGYNYRHYMVYE